MVEYELIKEQITQRNCRKQESDQMRERNRASDQKNKEEA